MRCLLEVVVTNEYSALPRVQPQPPIKVLEVADWLSQAWVLEWRPVVDDT